jgi:hypothetical protein
LYTFVFFAMSTFHRELCYQFGRFVHGQGVNPTAFDDAFWQRFLNTSDAVFIQSQYYDQIMRAFQSKPPAPAQADVPAPQTPAPASVEAANAPGAPKKKKTYKKRKQADVAPAVAPQPTHQHHPLDDVDDEDDIEAIFAREDSTPRQPVVPATYAADEDDDDDLFTWLEDDVSAPPSPKKRPVPLKRPRTTPLQPALHDSALAACPYRCPQDIPIIHDTI